MATRIVTLPPSEPPAPATCSSACLQSGALPRDSRRRQDAHECAPKSHATPTTQEARPVNVGQDRLPRHVRGVGHLYGQQKISIVVLGSQLAGRVLITAVGAARSVPDEAKWPAGASVRRSSAATTRGKLSSGERQSVGTAHLTIMSFVLEGLGRPFCESEMAECPVCVGERSSGQGLGPLGGLEGYQTGVQTPMPVDCDLLGFHEFEPHVSSRTPRFRDQNCAAVSWESSVRGRGAVTAPLRPP